LRLQAEMDNYRQRQRRLAHEQAAEEQARLLADILAVADDLERTLAAAQGEAAGRDAIRRGVELTRDKLLRTLRKYGVERVEAQGQPFDPAWHEAVEVTAAGAVEAGTVAEVRQPGYRRGERLLRPARVVVAQ
jgi:molecular chaperone GrpE